MGEKSPADKPVASQGDHPFELERIIFFSDAVFAIAITLLAIELKVPDLGGDQTNDHLFRALLDDSPHFFAFGLSFWNIASYWLAHHRYFRYITQYDAGLIGRNFVLLFFVVLLPFSTLVLGQYSNLTAAVWIYATNLIAIGLTGAWLWYHAGRHHALVEKNLDDRFIRFMFVRSFATPAAGVIVLLASFQIGVSANFFWLLIWVFQYLIRRYYKIAA